ncbi:amidase [Anaerobacillus alkaliphilus]|uniref:Amidase n=1 Tax=Anaerobacillus alkaliphilus TaxID=1548597 RepID=A0A4Q0VTL2_9BACI|nr:amidase [Anaerobacillus alkaliphilus]RXJ00373.1 amidase [Anaerobacillus alkaliphilus]
MKKIVVMFMVVLMVVSGMNAIQAQKPFVVATWLWDTNEIVTNEQEVLRFLQEKNVTDLYLQINRQIHVNTYRSFIEKATKLNIKVHALDGAPTWATRNGSKQYKPLIDWIRNYQSQATADQKFSGIHLDVEPYLLADWQKNQKNTVEFYQQFVIDFRSLANDLKIEYALDIPFWFDEINYRNKFGTGLLSEWLINQTDTVTIMAYRNFAEGPNGIIDLVKTEVAYAETKGKKVIIAVETEPSSEGTHISFSSLSVLDQELQKVINHYEKNTSYAGTAIHHYASWKTLIE